MSSGHDPISPARPGSLLPLTERERKELLAEVDRQIAEIDDRESDNPTVDSDR